jgi:DNA-binding NtrC family response regulator
MEEENTLLDEESTPSDQEDEYLYDAADKPFDFVDEEGKTALICESDPSIREKIRADLKLLGYMITETATAKDALKSMRFHNFEVVVINDCFDTTTSHENSVLQYLESLSMTVRRDMFVALVTERFRSMDNMAAFNKSVNLVINTKNIDDARTIIKRGISENTAFYRVFRESMQKTGKI